MLHKTIVCFHTSLYKCGNHAQLWSRKTNTFLNPRDHVIVMQIIFIFSGTNKNSTQFVKVLLVKHSNMLDSSSFVRLFHLQRFALYGTRISSASQLASQPAVRLGSASAMALEFLHNKSNRVGFMKLLF